MGWRNGADFCICRISEYGGYICKKGWVNLNELFEVIRMWLGNAVCFVDMVI